jgi:hypothetical protein
MIHPLCLGLTLPFVFGAARQEELPPGWQVFTSKQGGFTIKLPGAPMESKRRVASAAGVLDVYLFVVDGKDDASYVVSYSDLPGEQIKAGNEQKRLDFACEGAVNNARGKLRSEKKIELDGHPGRELIIDTDKEIVIRMRIYAVKQRLYQVMAIGPGLFTQSQDATRFLDSLRLVK